MKTQIIWEKGENVRLNWNRDVLQSDWCRNLLCKVLSIFPVIDAAKGSYSYITGKWTKDNRLTCSLFLYFSIVFCHLRCVVDRLDKIGTFTDGWKLTAGHIVPAFLFLANEFRRETEWTSHTDLWRYLWRSFHVAAQSCGLHQIWCALKGSDGFIPFFSLKH